MQTNEIQMSKYAKYNMQEYAIYEKYARRPLNMQKLHILCKSIFCQSAVTGRSGTPTGSATPTDSSDDR
jgi:hypothetical protein